MGTCSTTQNGDVYQRCDFKPLLIKHRWSKTARETTMPKYFSACFQTQVLCTVNYWEMMPLTLIKRSFYFYSDAITGVNLKEFKPKTPLNPKIWFTDNVGLSAKKGLHILIVWPMTMNLVFPWHFVDKLSFNMWPLTEPYKPVWYPKRFTSTT